MIKKRQKMNLLGSALLWSTGIWLLFATLFTNVNAQDSLTVTINEIAIDSISVRGMNAAFPHPILAFVTVSDTSGNFVSGLADTADWLGPNDMAPGGIISDIWTPLNEYFLQDPSQPQNSNIYGQRPEPLFLEVHNSVPTSTMLIMDESNSLSTSDWEFAKQGLLTYIDNMGSEDRAGVIRFTFNTQTLGFTSDKTALRNFINESDQSGGTRIFRALAEAIDSTKLETSLQRSIILFTDGRNNDPNSPDLDSLIAEANSARITIHTIAFGSSAGVADLQKIAGETGGLFFQTSSGTDLIALYSRLSNLINKFYVIAYTSPAPCGNEIISGDSTRVLDITVTDDLNRTGSATKNYVPPADANAYDLAISKTASPDSATISETVDYQIEVTNSGPNSAFNIMVIDSISDFLTPSAFNPAPDSTAGNRLFWMFDSLSAAANPGITITYAAMIAPDLPDTVSELTTTVSVIAACDSDLANNNAGNSVAIIRLPDLAVLTTVVTDSFRVSGNDTLWFAEENETYPYRITVRNQGKGDARNVLLTDIIPDSVRGDTFSGGDTVTWPLGNLPPQADTTLTFDVTVVDEVPFDDFPLINTVLVQAANDDPNGSGSKSAIDTVFAYKAPPPLTNIFVETTVQTDSFQINSGDTIWFAQEREPYAYRITVTNEGMDEALNVILTDVVPDSIRGENFSGGDTLIWFLGNLPPQTDTTLTLDVTVVNKIPFDDFPLINTVKVQSDNDDPAGSGSNSAVDTVFVYKPLTDVVVTTTVSSDSFTVSNSDTTWFVEAGDRYCLTIVVKNDSTFDAENVVLTYIVPDSVTGDTFDGGDTLIWNLGTLPPFADTSFTICPTVVETISTDLFPIINPVILTADNDDPNAPGSNSAEETVFAFPRIVPPTTDIAVRKWVSTDSFAVSGSDTTWLADPEEVFTYFISVRNKTAITATNAVVVDRLPALLIPDIASFQPPHGVYDGDSICWMSADTVLQNYLKQPTPPAQIAWNGTALRKTANPLAVEII